MKKKAKKESKKENNLTKNESRGLSLRDAINSLIDESVWDPFGEFRAPMFEDDFEEEFDFPATDISETKSAVKVKSEVPGVSQKDIDIEIEDGILTISGQTESKKEEKGETGYFFERHSGSFSRSFPLPYGLKEKDAKADLKDGILTITIPKSGKKDKKSAVKVRVK